MVLTIKMIPTHRIPLAMKPTPIHRWNVEDVPEEFSLSVKRDDLTGCTLSGNKVRKMEFILADAKAHGYTDVITSGSTQSNHARATLIAAKQVGLKCHLVLRDKDENCRTAHLSGNFLLMEAGEPDIYLIPWSAGTSEGFSRVQQQLAKQIRTKAAVSTLHKLAFWCSQHERCDGGEDPKRSAYCIPLGGHCPLGVHGYLYAWEEMMQQKIDERFDDVICAAGTCGTAIVLALGNYLTGSKLRIHTISIFESEKNIRDMINGSLLELGIEEVCSQDIIDVIDDYVGGGYNIFSKEDVEYCKHIAKTTGIYCDPVYVGKALKGLVKELKTNPGRFKGRRLLFIHTGGLFGMMESSVENIFRSKTTTDRIKDWSDSFQSCTNGHI